MSPRCQLSAKALRDLADLVEAGVVTLQEVTTTYSPGMGVDAMPFETSVDLKLHHSGAICPDKIHRKALVLCTSNLLTSVTQSNVRIGG